MDKSKAMKRLDAIEKEAAELRKIIERGDDDAAYDFSKLYIADINNTLYLLFGNVNSLIYSREGLAHDFYWLSFRTACPSQCRIGDNWNARTALTYARDNGTLYAFSDHKEGMAFFAKRYAELN